VTRYATWRILSGVARDDPPNFCTSSLPDFIVANPYLSPYYLDEVMVRSLFVNLQAICTESVSAMRRF
jgi:hypothetical protein